MVLFDGLLTLGEAFRFFLASLGEIAIVCALILGYIAFAFPLVGKYRHFANDNMGAGEIWKCAARDGSLILAVTILAGLMMWAIAEYGNIFDVLGLFFSDAASTISG